MSLSPLIVGRDPGALDSIELAILAGAVRALRTRADKQREKAAGGIAAAGIISPACWSDRPRRPWLPIWRTLSSGSPIETGAPI